MSWTQEEIDRLTARLLRKAQVDMEFRKRCLANPMAVLREAAGKDIPPGFKLTVLDCDHKADLTLVLPPPASAELSDEELEGVAGGDLCAADNVCGAQVQLRR